MFAHLPPAEKLEALELLEQREAYKAAASLREYVRYVPIPGVPVTDDEDCEEFYPDQVRPAAHHRLILQALQCVVDGTIKRLLLMLPPGSAKSTYASVVFPPFYMGVHAGSNLISLSYGDVLAKKFGRRCRSIARSAEYQRVFQTGLVGDNKAVDDWSIQNASSYMCGGMLSGITGHRADGLIIDDPIKGREDADSDTIREKVWEAYKSDIRTRLKPKGWIVLIGTRWHEDDPIGRILPDGYEGQSGWVTAKDGERWYVLNLPAQCERQDDPLGRQPGEYLWTEWFSPEHWEQERKSQGPRNWLALYQQRPASEGGDYFKREWLRYYDHERPPPHMTIYMAADYAVTANDGDWTVIGVFGITPDDDIYILDWWRQQASSDVWAEAICDLVLKWHPLELIEEAGQIAKGVGPFLEKRQRERRAYCAHKLYTSAENKPTRAQAIRGRIAQGKLYIPKLLGWMDAFVYEVLKFRPGATVDDQVDVLSLLGRRLAELARPRVEMTAAEKEAERVERMRRVAHEKATWNDAIKDTERRSGRDGSRIA